MLIGGGGVSRNYFFSSEIKQANRSIFNKIEKELMKRGRDELVNDLNKGGLKIKISDNIHKIINS